ncbi:MAG: UDP-N-acetylglucosamine 2-epimerase (non-hydrolyzing), partial [Candidatus Wallbacteria bacterium]|nr:UDP-N-acetylglucosamine 2-epimerase (non-hydrolyzing) [Candidatus Wallbacteria bacterium]
MKKILFVFGTRPEAIKFAPLIKACQAEPGFDTRIAVTAQHRQMLDQVLNFFGIAPHHDLDLMRPGQDLFSLTSGALTGIKGVLEREKPDLVFVQGDTTTVFAAALAAFYLQIPVAHLEAGLRSFDMRSPFPEEANRVLAGHLSTWHFAPTDKAAENLAAENIKKNVFVVGNTVIDALHLALSRLEHNPGLKKTIIERFDNLSIRRLYSGPDRLVLITGHRRESFGQGFMSICRAIRALAEEFPDCNFVYPVHLNPNVQKPVHEILTGMPNIFLDQPLDYPYLVTLMQRSCLVLTDSGGIQEEAPSLGKPVVVMRDVTERTEGVTAGTAILTG